MEALRCLAEVTALLWMLLTFLLWLNRTPPIILSLGILKYFLTLNTRRNSVTLATTIVSIQQLFNVYNKQCLSSCIELALHFSILNYLIMIFDRLMFGLFIVSMPVMMRSWWVGFLVTWKTTARHEGIIINWTMLIIIKHNLIWPLWYLIIMSCVHVYIMPPVRELQWRFFEDFVGRAADMGSMIF